MRTSLPTSVTPGSAKTTTRAQKAIAQTTKKRARFKSTAKRWSPKQALFTPAALAEPWGQQIYRRVSEQGIPAVQLKNNRITGIKAKSDRETYANAKQTLAVVTAPPSTFKLQPIPPSADWQFHLAQGCPAHCQYCYLASSLSGPPVIKVFANLPDILENTSLYMSPKEDTTSFEVSCYTDPLSLEHLTGSLSECIRYFGTQPNGRLRWVSKFDNVEPLLNIEHQGHTRCRVSVNANPVSRGFEGGTAEVSDRLKALRQLALPKVQGGGGYPVGVVIAPIMAFEDWHTHYSALFEQIADALDFDCDLTFELITHRFTNKSKQVLTEWYPNSKLDMEMTSRTTKRNKFGGIKYVYNKPTTQSLRDFFEEKISRTFPNATLLYWT